LSDGRLVVCVLGPPASGKTSATTRVAESRNCSVFRFRDAARAAALRDSQVANALRTTRDPLGWIDDDAGARVLMTRLPSGDDPLVIENFPGSAAQVHLLGDALRERGERSRVAAVELAVSEAELMRRADARRVCPACEPDPSGDPHMPAPTEPDEPERCGRCGRPLVRRRSDRPDIREERLRRYETRRPAIVQEFRGRGWGWERVNAECSRRAVADALGAVIDRLVVST
jgi:adenylate kinase family enzyme